MSATDSKIVMAEQSSRDVVDQSLSGGEPSPSDVPASTNDKFTAGGDEGETKHIATNLTTQSSTDPQSNHDTRCTPDPQSENIGAGLVASRALELNGGGSASDAGDDTASQGGSESDASRTDGRHHTRTGSVKKPATFKPVSFAKFAVPKAPGAAAPPKAPEKVPSTSTTPLGTPQPSSRPRLVAKTTPGNSLSKSGSNTAKPGGTGPDPNQVWNKNRPVQPTPTKHLTDEELKQQYGIHMTSRIQEDGGGGSEAKWADIDDDEDDWAPETIEWTDGTKVTLTHNDNAPPPENIQEEPKQDATPDTITAKDPVKIAAPKPTTSVGPNPTVLRLGGNAERKAKGASISSNDRVPSGSTSPAPPPAKSPWAALPPVERVSPVNQTAHPLPPSRVPPHYQHRDDHYHASLPPQEIAADDFNRQWRDSPPGAPRELFNSRSGRYEPVPDNRRPSWRHDQGPRAPAVLQRSGQDMNGPAEPSAAFQTHRHHQEGMGWNRRRTSSNVSGGSGGYGRRPSFGRVDGPPRHFEARRGSLSNGMVDPALMERDYGHHYDATPRHHPSAPIQASPAASVGGSVAAENPSAAVPEAPQEDPVALQERIMKETRMLARQRRLEQEEQERQAKEERIRQKLAALGPPPDKPRKDSESRKAPPTASASVNAPVNSPPKPPVPEPSGETTQYGLIKIHPPDSIKKPVNASERDRGAEKHASKPPAIHSRQTTSPRDIKREPVHPRLPTQLNFRNLFLHTRRNLNLQIKVPHKSRVSYPPWSTNANLAATSPSVKNPWKPLSSDRTLGNGIFDQALGGFPPRELPLRSSLGLDQPAMSAQTLSGPQEATALPSLPSPETTLPAYEPLSPIGRPGPIAPPGSRTGISFPIPAALQRTVGTWGSFHALSREKEIEEGKQRRIDFEKARQDDQRSAPLEATSSWKKPKPLPEGRVKRDDVEEKKLNNNASPSNPLTGLDAVADGLPFTDNGRPLASVPVRSSRFFPHATEQPKRKASAKVEHSRSPSPPPPEESSHPVYGGRSGRPHVHLPNPKPVVKLPQAAKAKAHGPPVPPPTFASMAAAPPRGVPAPAGAISWQEKINGLFGKKTPPEKKSSLAVTSATKEPLDVQRPATAVPVSVSFPSKDIGSQSGDGDLAVRQVDEQDEIFEDREPGSQPPVRVPNMAPPAAWRSAPAPSQAPIRPKYGKLQFQTAYPYQFGPSDRDHTGHLQVLIRLPGSTEVKTVSLPKKAQVPRQQRSSSGYNKSRRGPKPRDISGNNAPSKKPSPQQGSAPSSHRHQSRNANWGPRKVSPSN
ncbi:hypothetical protein N7532_003255 [Penicillium argentinense]|uniref:Uncharacterized protein n=1 Tax=Penicillium argentinense TaxID=1131581 RepID=A0A9W9FM36_9EURO|nr:uncharacterized protein N7532_003255 [Penicillium argentinense]KAJ5102726.1 hypothetical protein N7532_003255 [Penicillium argentinense]